MHRRDAATLSRPRAAARSHGPPRRIRFDSGVTVTAMEDTRVSASKHQPRASPAGHAVEPRARLDQAVGATTMTRRTTWRVGVCDRAVTSTSSQKERWCGARRNGRLTPAMPSTRLDAASRSSRGTTTRPKGVASGERGLRARRIFFRAPSRAATTRRPQPRMPFGGHWRTWRAGRWFVDVTRGVSRLTAGTTGRRLPSSHHPPTVDRSPDVAASPSVGHAAH